MTAPAARRFQVPRSPLGITAGVLLAAVGFTALVGPIVFGARARAIDTNALSQGPSGHHLLGTDALGRDLFYRLIVASRLSVELALAAAAMGVAIGVVLGLAPFVLHHRLGRPVTALINILLAFPPLLVVLFLAVIFGVSTSGAVFALALAMAPFYARLTQSLTASIAGRDFVAAARIAGLGRLRIAARHLLPNIADQLIVNATIGAGGALLSFAGLSFLGIGVQSPQYDWGRLLNEGVSGIYTNPAGALGPAVAVVLAGLAFNLAGEAAVQARNADRAQVSAGEPRRRGPSAGGRPVVDEPAGRPSDTIVLDVQGLEVSFPGQHGWVSPVRGVSFTVTAGEAVGIVGESGSGKSLTALAVSGLVDVPGRVRADRLDFAGIAMNGTLDAAQRRRLAMSLSVVFQDPSSSFNPVHKVGSQLAELSRRHQGLSRRSALNKAVTALTEVRIPAARRRALEFPHELSGGMRQRAMIAMGLMGEPRMTVADEPTTALDATVQRAVLGVLDEQRAQHDAVLLLISHDMDVITRTCDRVLVMYAGRIVEDLPTSGLHADAKHPYTRALLEAIPSMTVDRSLPLAAIAGRPPEPGLVPVGCAFAPRCDRASARCVVDDPELVDDPGEHRIACWNPHPNDPAAAGSEATELRR